MAISFQGWTVAQAEALRFKGLKPVDDGRLRIFLTTETARDYLADLLKTIKHEQSIDWRTKDNLDPKKKLDFLILPCVIQVEEDGMKKRGWTLDGQTTP